MEMTQVIWNALSPAERDKRRDTSDLTAQLRGLEGYRVEVVDTEHNGGQTRRFNVGKSTGWRPCHLEVHNSRSLGGQPAAKSYQSVRLIRKIR